ncbi:DNA-directed RNA polymerase subunit beta' [Clostridium acetobutylicum]|uniref:DNA-directed RNA polymerase subunit beta' n=1 Tax=Clostridium acetobutylicum (strain ATCC 824 / DSM 792 / JCM 1419 / IAM 19013 / LMG 5710 / NBRC 13948 / NRRL B-527 / VKM B-1787 / 2291 / W) TaxID=272562 RepID=RPOC_CLOAB|nr:MULTISPECIES: DNA-directed RNA polymerase subunit beta' [Clostridium]Q97EH0.1 RecName: Full=DNA-directed RNA polymerase subunit beta'; Short=RNAP subunit beta'; AltName: Full=RNA polymerase subunit beta'; AltName: Full=Transcriptase subunit beta' [Clostridium acetobutylicum ATCC 824]AAK81080.1 DNA-dependent RNA polymerase beta' subunit [Clostridium acetobutylicum ATCC 824]ADZ22183.1 DNA-directed RNA polymerase subunit beta' [Clostridium acetobutylicum EA 2018]AEI33765.1 DNA-directed RNA poly
MELNKFDALQIGLASPEKIREWSRGEVKKPETINYRTLKPEKDGLFCERIFGPIKDWECHCGKYKRVRYKGIVCDRCGVEVTKSKVRRERMGHIELAAPVSHIWYFKGIPSRMGLILDMSPRALEKVLYFASYLVLDPKETPLLKKQLLNEKEYREAADKYGEESFEAGMGAESIKKLLQEIDLNQLSEELKENLKTSTGQKKVRIIRRLEVVESFRKSTNKPEWMIMDVIPVIPPDLRPMVQLDGGRFATSDLNDLYRRVINRNNRLKKLLDLGAPDIIVRNEKRMLQEAVDALIDNGRRGRPVTGPGNRPLKSLSDMLKGKQGRFRQNLLGKRVDYSGRSVIVVGPDLKMYQCGLPKEMALELFKPFVMKKLVETGAAHNIKSAKRMVERVQNQVWDVLEEVISDHPVMLNRAPTLHRLGIQAFQPILVEGRAIKLHPLACTAYNADFDGDQMAVHVPLSVEAQAESRFLMLAAHNILKPSDGKPVCVPTQDMVLGSYYLTIDKDGVKGEGKAFTNVDEALMAYQLGEIDIHAKIKVRLEKEIDGKMVSGIIETTIGKLIFNESIPQDLGFIDRSIAGNELLLEINFLVGKKNLGGIIDKCYRKHGPTKTSIMLDKIKAKGYHYSTISAITVSTSDMTVPPNKGELMSEAETAVEKIEKMYRRGFISDDERYERVISTWTKTTEKVADALMDNLDRFNPIFMMADSGARGSKSQIKQLAGMRGLMANPSGKIIELPIKASFREGLDVLEYFISTHGARKGNADTALKTADSGYLTRRLVDVSQDVIVRNEDCGATEGFEVSEIKEGNEVIESLSERLIGRYTSEDIIDPTSKEVLVKQNEYIDEDKAIRIEKVGVKKVKIRSVFTCNCKYGVCAKCYGMDMATAEKISMGEAVGIVAAQSIGEPGTQLTMRTFHTGGVAGSDITQGLPRVEELFEARKPKGLAIVSEVSGTVRIEETKKKRIVFIATESGEEVSYDIPFGSSLKVKNGETIGAGDEITEGSVNPHDIIRIKGVNAVKNYLLSEVQKVYRLQGVDINDKHLEVVIRQMTRKVKVEDSGDTELLPGTMIDIFDFRDENKKVEENGGRPAQARVSLLGITKAALATDSFLSAASFQETTRVLTDAAIKGKSDPLVGLKENVTIGKLIPAGTGMNRYKNIEIDPLVTETNADDENFIAEDKIEG